MSRLIEIRVPDIGDFKDVGVIEILVNPGDPILQETSLVTVESDKATMEIPSPSAGIVKEVRVKLGDRISEGSLLLTLTEEKQSQEPVTGNLSDDYMVTPASAAAPVASATMTLPAGATVDVECEILVLGSGPGGYSAAFRAADLGKKVVLVERYATLGGVCLNVGCIPSKALLHVAAVMGAAAHLSEHGISFGEPQVDLGKLRAWKDRAVGKLTTGLAGMAKMRKVTLLQGTGSFLDANHLAVQTKDGPKLVRFSSAIIAAGSQPSRLPLLPEDSRIVDSTGALELKSVPRRMLVIGGGIIGLEMGTVYSTLGARLDVVEMMDGLMMGPDRDLVSTWQKFNALRFDNVMLKTRTAKVEPTPQWLKVWFEGENAPAEPQLYELILVSVGRSPNGKKIGAENAGVAVDERGFIPVDSQMRTSVPHIYAIGDIVGQPMLAHKAVHEGHVAAEAAAGRKSRFDARVIPGVAYTDPEIAWVGITEDEAQKKGVKIGVSKFPWAASGRAIANGRDEGFTKLIFDAGTHRVIGAGIVGTGAGDLISELALAIEMGADAVDIGKTIHPHPTLGESVGMAAELYEGVCTDMPPVKRK